eukprot:GHVU01194454.1.p2 GENE.GHVU01194454.1~~GHVU01194454.1.p2  ORF type:complete len:145 (+),score=20.07 GHVU01194454.1:35-436(+)
MTVSAAAAAAAAAAAMVHRYGSFLTPLSGHSSVMGAKGAPNASQPRARATVSESGDNNATAKVTTKKPTGCAAGCNQQKMRSWQPVLTTPWAISIFICVGVFFIVIGAGRRAGGARWIDSFLIVGSRCSIHTS